MPGTNTPYGAICLRTMRRLVRQCAICLRTRCTMSGTSFVPSGPLVRTSNAMPGTDTTCDATRTIDQYGVGTGKRQ
eukprot:3670509-Rhodomonas_salina.2